MMQASDVFGAGLSEAGQAQVSPVATHRVAVPEFSPGRGHRLAVAAPGGVELRTHRRNTLAQYEGTKRSNTQIGTRNVTRYHFQCPMLRILREISTADPAWVVL